MNAHRKSLFNGTAEFRPLPNSCSGEILLKIPAWRAAFPSVYKSLDFITRSSVHCYSEHHEVCDSRRPHCCGRRGPSEWLLSTGPFHKGVLEVVEVVPILRDDRVQEDDGRYNYDIETGDGITASESGSPDVSEGAIVASGKYSYTAPDGSLIEVANEDGFQPEGDHLPVAPESPHEIPEFVLRQIAKAAEEYALATAETRDAAPSQLYQRPQ
ncbi:pupal cuticle protein-like [Penaeus indicus]|uniref:pupal cuticle protein-like n=1 Tax=Penaeus indicus TaxID=29960 RepID=UPI00300CD8C2